VVPVVVMVVVLKVLGAPLWCCRSLFQHDDHHADYW
jgi:hypothetical protein